MDELTLDPTKQRVFRGQTKEYLAHDGTISLLPALTRFDPPKEYDTSWVTPIATFLARDLLKDNEQIWSGSPDIDAVFGPALLQHYGPGSKFLDVTSDLTIATWFSLHKRHERWVSIPLSQVFNFYFSVAWYERVDNSDPVIYVFDVAAWKGEGALRGSQLIDLLSLKDGQKLVETATRLAVQSASLLYAGPTPIQDLHKLIRARIYLAKDFGKDTSPLSAVSTLDLFPPPSKDPCYKAIVELDFSLAANAPTDITFDEVHFEHPLAIPYYFAFSSPPWKTGALKDTGGIGEHNSPIFLEFPHAFSEAADFWQKIPWAKEFHDYAMLTRCLQPPLCYFDLINRQSQTAEEEHKLQVGDRLFILEEATPFLLETAVWTMTPSAPGAGVSTFWIPFSLPVGIADRIAGHASDNVFIELSSLDAFSFPLANSAASVLRGVWIVRNDTEYGVTLYYFGQPYRYSVQFHFDPETGVFTFKDPSKKTDIVSHNSPNENVLVRMALKSLFVTLTLLRDLSPGLKPPAMYVVFVDEEFHIPWSLLEPQLATATQVEWLDDIYIVPKATDGTRYACSRTTYQTTNWPHTPQEAGIEISKLLPFFPKDSDLAGFAHLVMQTMQERGLDLYRASNIVVQAATTSRTSLAMPRNVVGFG